MLLQVMSEEQHTGFETSTAADGRKTIRSIGTDPWQVKAISGAIRFKSQPERLRVTALSPEGRPDRVVSLQHDTLQLLPATLHYLVERAP